MNQNIDMKLFKIVADAKLAGIQEERYRYEKAIERWRNAGAKPEELDSCIAWARTLMVVRPKK